MRTTSQCSEGQRATISPVASTCPCTMCPPSRLPSAAARSRFTRLPGRSSPRLDRFSVSAITSAVNWPSGNTSTTVRHTPLTAIESPWPASAVTIGPRMVSRAASTRASRPVTSPRSSTIPVNIAPG
ncbi:Uncharacterised protein [Mycobacterium tuberculosis]|uniref:Uncharacterized protein n=1 Tax=Mycobacterium tuberculosis TaxID=1773 RepID=A0A916P848_MYCTX|nr:Uncharacterised protein [Mycobacterium tuberculosis]